MTQHRKSELVLIGLVYLAFVSLGLPDGLIGVAWPSISAYFREPNHRSEAFVSNGSVYQSQASALNAMITPMPRRTTPSGLLSCRPQLIFFSIAISVPSASIHPILPAPKGNISSIRAQQHPMQKIP